MWRTGHSRDCHACVGIVESTVNSQPRDIRNVCVEVLDVITLRLDLILAEVGEIVHGRMASGAVIALLSQN